MSQGGAGGENNAKEEKASSSSNVNPLAEEKKTSGNKAYAAKDYDEAIQRYNEAIEIDPENHIYYSNRSACYGSKGDWNEAAADAKTCIDKDPDFLKGYYRLTLAQIELKEYDEAIETIRSGLRKQPENPELQKQLRIVKAKKNAAESARHPDGGPDARVSGEELQEVQEQYMQASRESKEVRNRSMAVRSDKKRTELTLTELSNIPEETRLFRSLGKLFMLTPRTNIVKLLEKRLEEDETRGKDLEARQSYLEAKLSSHESMLKEANRFASRGS